MKTIIVLFIFALALVAQDASNVSAQSIVPEQYASSVQVIAAPCPVPQRAKKPAKKTAVQASVMPTAPAAFAAPIPAEWVWWLAVYAAAMSTLCLLLILALVARGNGGTTHHVVAMPQPLPQQQPLIQPAMIQAPPRLDHR